MARGRSTRPLVLVKGRDYHLSLWLFSDIGGGNITVYHRENDEVEFIAELSCPDIEDLPFLAVDWLTQTGIEAHEIQFYIPDPD